MVICFLIGIDRAWELVGGPTIGISREVVALVRSHERDAGDPDSKRGARDPGGKRGAGDPGGKAGSSP